MTNPKKTIRDAFTRALDTTRTRVSVSQEIADFIAKVRSVPQHRLFTGTAVQLWIGDIWGGESSSVRDFVFELTTTWLSRPEFTDEEFLGFLTSLTMSSRVATAYPELATGERPDESTLASIESGAEPWLAAIWMLRQVSLEELTPSKT